LKDLSEKQMSPKMKAITKERAASQPLQERSLETRQDIMASALEQFARHGYEAASVNEICLAAGVSKGAFYHHFSSKQELFLELLTTWLDLMDGQFALLRAQSDNVPQALAKMTVMFGEVYTAAGGNLPVFLEFWSQAQYNPQIWQSVIDPYRRYQKYFAEMLQEGIDEGSLKPIDPQMTAQVMVAQAVGLLLQGLLDPDGADWQRVTQYGFQMILNDLLV
jgi:AcrR family transcriptional regulator